MINKCLNQKNYKKYISEVVEEPNNCKDPINCHVQVLVHPKSDQILEYREMLIIDKISLLGNLGGLLGLFVGFSVFGYASILVDVILNNIKPGILSLIPGQGSDVPSNMYGNNGLNGGGHGNARNPIVMAHPGSRGSSGGSLSITIPT